MAHLLLQSVLEATSDGRLDWEPDPVRRSSVASWLAGSGPTTRRLVAALGDGDETLSLELQREDPGRWEVATLAMRGPAVTLCVRGADGAVVRRVPDSQLDPADQLLLMELWEAAERRAMGPREVDERVRQLLSRLPAKTR